MTILASFVLFPIVSGAVGLTMFGLWMFVSSLTLFFALDFGLSTALVRYVAEADARSDRSLVSTYASSIFALLAVIAVVGSLAFLVAMAIFWPSLDLAPGQGTAVVVILVAVVVSTFWVSLPFSVFRVVIAGVHRYDIVNLLTVLQAIVRLAVILVVLHMGSGIVAVVVADAGVSIAIALLSFVICHRLVPDLAISRRRVSLKTVRAMAPFAGPVFVMQASALFILQSDNLVVGTVLSTASVALYAGAFRLYQVCREVTNSVTAPLIPEASRRSAIAGSRDLGGMLLSGTKFANAAMLLVAVPLLVFARPVLVGWAGEDFGSVAGVLRVLLIGLVINNNHLVAISLLTGMGVVRSFARYHVLWAATNLLLSILLARRFGLVGVALGTTLPVVVLEPFYVRTALRALGVPWRAFVSSAIGRVAGPAVLAAIPLAIAVTAWPSGGLPRALACSAMWGAFFIAAFITFGLDGGERARVRSSLSRWRTAEPAVLTRAGGASLIPGEEALP